MTNTFLFAITQTSVKGSVCNDSQLLFNLARIRPDKLEKTRLDSSFSAFSLQTLAPGTVAEVDVTPFFGSVRGCTSNYN